MRIPFHMKIMRISCENVTHVYNAKKIYNFHVKSMRLSIHLRTYYIFHGIIMRTLFEQEHNQLNNATFLINNHCKSDGDGEERTDLHLATFHSTVA